MSTRKTRKTEQSVTQIIAEVEKTHVSFEAIDQKARGLRDDTTSKLDALDEVRITLEDTRRELLAASMSVRDQPPVTESVRLLLKKREIDLKNYRRR